MVNCDWYFKNSTMKIGLFVIGVAFVTAWFIRLDLLAPQTLLSHNPRPYIGAEFLPTDFPARTWMTRAMGIIKDENLAPASAARFYVYVASVYADTLENTQSPQVADAATTVIINELLPHRTPIILEYPLTPEARIIVDEYIKRIQNDNYYIEWDENIPIADGWFIRDENVDKGAMAGTWRPWFVHEKLIQPVPPKNNSIQDWYEITKVIYTSARKSKKSEVVYFWHGTRGFVKGQIHDNITPAGVWQNILFVEGAKEETNASYAQKQKLLAQTIADAFIEAWKIKYTWYTKRPSMKIPNLTPMVADPPFPGFPSGHATISEAAATILSSLYPAKRTLWYELSRDARNSRLVAGIHFDIDNTQGARVGAQVGQEILQSIHAPYVPSPIAIPKPARPIVAITHGALMRLQLFLRTNIEFLTRSALTVPQFRIIPIASTEPEQLGNGAAWADVDTDGDTDLFTHNRLYINDAGVLRESEDASGLIHEYVSSAVFFDYNNDGCPDVYLSRYGEGPVSLRSQGAPDKLLQSSCDGTFVDISRSAGISDSSHGFGVAAADYNRDGFTDVYVANWGVMLGSGDSGVTPDTYRAEPNILWRNNGNGTFTDVTEQAGVTGFTACPNIANAKFTHVKPSYQPIWFDYNNDLLPDLFVATDFLISPLYKNNGDGTFTDVTREAGLCVNGPSSNMGVAAADVDSDGDIDLYVTNGGKNDFWRNNGDGTFTDVVKDFSADDNGYGWGVGFLDANNDGRLDILVVNGNNNQSLLNDPRIKQDNSDELLLQQEDGTFTPVGERAGLVGHEVKRGMGIADYNMDGFPDVFVASERLPEGVAKRFYTNTPNGNEWISLRLVGTKSNRDAIGAVIKIVTNKGQQYRTVDAGSSFLSQNTRIQTFGLGKGSTVKRIEVQWPSGIVQVLTDRKLNTLHTVYEP